MIKNFRTNQIGDTKTEKNQQDPLGRTVSILKAQSLPDEAFPDEVLPDEAPVPVNARLPSPLRLSGMGQFHSLKN